MRKLLSMLLSVAMMASTMATVAFAAAPSDVDPQVEMNATVIEIDSDGYPVVKLSATAKGAEAVTDGKKKSGNGLTAVKMLLQLDESLFTATAIDSDVFTVSKPSVGLTSWSVQPGNIIQVELAIGDWKEMITGTAEFTVSVEPKDDTKTVEEYNAKLGAFTDYYGIVERYTDNVLVSTTRCGNFGTCAFPAKATAGSKPVIEEKDPVVTGVTVTADKDVAADGETVTFTAVVEGTEGVAADGSAIPVPQDVVWSDNVVGGVYTAVADYEDKEVTVTATAKGTEISGSKTITVSKKAHEVIDPVITGITIDPETVAVKGGETVTFTADVTGTDGQDATGAVVPYDKTVTWSANAPEGVFTAPEAKEEAQTFEVTATTADGKVATATVKVYGETPVVGITGVEITDAKATMNDVFKAQNTMYWGVKITNGMKGAVEAWMTADAETSKTTTLDFSNVTINGDAEFGIFTKVAAERLDKAISLNVKDVASGTVGMSTAASYNSLAK